MNPHFTDVKTDSQGTSVACQVTQLVRPGWGWRLDANPTVWLWSPSYWPTMLDCLSGAPVSPWGHHRQAVARRDHSAALSNPTRPADEAPQLPYQYWDEVVDFSGLSGAVPRDLCSPHPLEQMGKACIHHEGWWGVTAPSCPPRSFPAGSELGCSPSLVVTYPLVSQLLVFLGRPGFGEKNPRHWAGYFVAL